MSDEKMIRLENLKLILRQRQWGAHELSQATVGPDGKPKWSRSHCADLLAERKSFGEKAARYLEEQVLLIPRFWLDQPHDEDDLRQHEFHNAGNPLTFPENVGRSVASPQTLGVAHNGNSPSGSNTRFRSPSLVHEWADFGSNRVSDEVVEQRPFDALVAPGSFPATFELTRVAGDWMEPDIRQGEYIWVDRTIKPKSEDIVIAEDTTTGRSFLGSYDDGYGGHFYVTPRKGKPADSAVHPVRVLAVMVYHLRSRRGSPSA